MHHFSAPTWPAWCVGCCDVYMCSSHSSSHHGGSEIRHTMRQDSYMQPHTNGSAGSISRPTIPSHTRTQSPLPPPSAAAAKNKTAQLKQLSAVHGPRGKARLQAQLTVTALCKVSCAAKKGPQTLKKRGTPGPVQPSRQFGSAGSPPASVVQHAAPADMPHVTHQHVVSECACVCACMLPWRPKTGRRQQAGRTQPFDDNTWRNDVRCVHI